ncbi:MAG TPA: hypothetical protein VHK03_05005 [Aestuariivirgaceae bacterium]|jgi:hypothetical protein|nr:hypothetical protein [Aestuariivirgaceae bacterium]
MTESGNRAGLSRRTILKTAGSGLIVAAITPAGMILGRKAWSATAEALKPDSFATLVQMSRDIYPHSRLEDKFYAAAVSALDAAAKADEAVKKALEDGVAALDDAAGKAKGAKYIAIDSEDARTSLLHDIETSAFFQKVRGNLVTGIYNNKEVWPLFGYEGESASKGGYIHRGFDDVAWL